MRLIPFGIAALLVAPLPAAAVELPIPILAAENFYGEAAAAVGGDRVKVDNVLINANVDPHDFDPSPSVARSVADAAIIVFNGADYDPWMDHLVQSTDRPDRVVIAAAPLIGAKEGDNPHVWYDPRTMPAVANALAKALAALDPDGAAGYEAGAKAYVASLAPINVKVADIKQHFAGTPVTATEPVFGYMADALGLTVGNQDFQTAIMNETEPSATEIAALEGDLKNHRVKVLIYNTQVTDAMTDQLLSVAKAADVPVVGVTETLPSGMDYPQWMLGQLDSLDEALASPSS